MKTFRLFLIVSVLFNFFVPNLFAHEHRKVGSYDFVVGFLNEPAFSGEMNGIDLRISSADKPVEGLEKTLEAAVLSADESMSMPLKLRKRYKQPGNYAAYFLPVQPGKYIFQIKGNIQGASINETFESGEDSFHDVEDSAALKFPSV